MRRNPENLDEATIMAACLVRLGAVDPGYTAEQYRSDFESDSGALGPNRPHDAELGQCITDPLDILG
jgi:hypothetical protein